MGMDANTARTVNMRQRVADAGGPAEWARRYGGARWQAPQVSQWISEAKPKGIGNTLARDLELAMGLAHGVLDRPPASQSQSVGLDPEMLAASIKLVRLAFENLETEHNPEEDGLPTALAYAYLRKREQRAVTAENVVDFSKYLRRAMHEGDDDRVTGVGGTGESNRRSSEKREAS